MSDVYQPCLCGSGKKFKFCCLGNLKSKEDISSTYCKFPIYECKMFKHWETAGITSVFVSRKMTNDSYILTIYLVDLWCLGVKDAIVKSGLSKRDIQEVYDLSEELITISYEDARSIILGAIDFAKIADIAPHPSWFGTPSSFIEASLPYKNKFSFGENGVHHYFSGTNDYESYDVKEIMRKVCLFFY